VRLTERSTVGETAAAVATTLREAGFQAVLTGGGCASIYTRGISQSVDLDFILQTGRAQSDLDRAMSAAGFERQANQYFHPRARFYVEFPPGPLSIGRDFDITPVQLEIRGRRILALSPTDSCRDRMAAFLHWKDRQNLETAIQIALRNDIDLARIRSWCSREGVPEGFDEFMRLLALRRDRPKKSRSRKEARSR
jgi:hypothetical protein